MDFQREKAIVRAFCAALDGAEGAGITATLTAAATPDYRWRGFHPFGEIKGAEEAAERFWRPLRAALTSMQRREDVFFAGRNQIDGFQSVWVASMGHLMGLFDHAWLGIAPTRKLTLLRYCEFHRVEGDKIAETTLYFDIPHLMSQAGAVPFPAQTAQHLVQPGPRTHDGLLHAPQPAAEGEATLAAINAMIADLGTWGLGLPLEEELRRTWREDMLWWGPEGVGATYTIPRYAAQHSGPFRAAFSDRTKTGHLCRMAEGAYGGFFGWPNFTARWTGPWLGREPTGKTAEFRVIDIYRRAGDKLAENWIFIDIPHFLEGQGQSMGLVED